MEIKIIEEEKNKIIFELIGEGHSLCNALKKELWNVKGVIAAGYTIKHPLVGIPRIVLETDGKVSPKDALKKASDALIKKSDEFSKEFTKVAK
jgi:DNA-directed RNA polymerase subunit L